MPRPIDPQPGVGDLQLEVERAHEIALRRLTVRARSRAELESDLVKRGIGEVARAEVIDRLTRAGLIDDAEFARQWVTSRRRTKGLSLAALRQELRGKGVAPEIISAVLDEVTAPTAPRLGSAESYPGLADPYPDPGSYVGDGSDDWPGAEEEATGGRTTARLTSSPAGDTDETIALAFARRKAVVMAGLDRQTFERRLAGQLARRGFSPGVTYRVVNQAWSELQTD